MTAGTARFPPRLRLSNAKEFARVFQQSRRSSDRLFTVLARPTELGYPRLGLAISKKRLRLASGRNRVKRLVRESFRQQTAIAFGLDVVVLARNDLDQAENSAILDSLERHWNRLV